MTSCSGAMYFHKVNNTLLASRQALRDVFREMWHDFNNSDWKSTDEQKRQLMKQLSPNVFKPFVALQCVYLYFKDLQDGLKVDGDCLEDWDFYRLSLILQNYFSSDDDNMYKLENEGVMALTDLRNELDKNEQKTLSEGEYNEKMGILKRSLLKLNVTVNDVDKLIEKAGVSCSASALEAAKHLFEKADNHLNEEEFGKAAEYYGQAIIIPSLLPLDQAIGFENRAACYLKLAKNIGGGSNLTDCDSAILERNDLAEKAIADAKEALERNDSSWNTHYILAQSFMLRNVLVPAIFHYKRALGIAPQLAQREIHMELESCRVLAGLKSITEKRTYYDYHYPKYWSLNSALKQEIKKTVTIIYSPFHKQKSEKSSIFEADKKSRERDGIRLIWFMRRTILMEVEIREVVNIVYRNLPTISDSVLAFNTFFSRVPISTYEKASDLITELYYEKHSNNFQASKEDMEVRCCYISIITPSCKHNTDKKSPCQCHERLLASLRLAEQGLKMYPENLSFYELIHMGCSAINNHEEGLRYAEQGLKTLPNHLTLLRIKAYHIYRLHDSQKVRRDEVIGVCRDFLNVAPCDHPNVPFMYYCIASLYKEDLITRNAKRRSCARRKIKHYYWLGKALEQCYAVSSPEHYKIYVEPGLLKIVKDIEHCLLRLETAESLENAISVEIGDLDSFKVLDLDFLILYNKTKPGSQLVDEVKKKMVSAASLNLALEQEETLNHIEKEFIVVQMYRAATPDFDFFSIPTRINHLEKLELIIAEKFSKKCGYEKSKDDMRIRFCYVGFNLGIAQMHRKKYPKNLGTSGVELLKKGIQFYPHNPHYYELLCGIFVYLEDYKSGLWYVIKGLKKFPDCEGLLYLKAVLLQLQQGSQTEAKSEEIIIAYKEFLSKVPEEHRKVPHAYYGIGCEYIRDLFEGSEAEKSKAVAMIKQYYKLGMEAEKYLLQSHLNTSFASNKGRDMISYAVRLIDSNVLPHSSSASSNKVLTEGNGVSAFAGPSFVDVLNKLLLMPLTPNLKELLIRQANQFAVRHAR